MSTIKELIAQATPGPWITTRKHPDPHTNARLVELFPATGGVWGDWSSQEICCFHGAEGGNLQESNAQLIARCNPAVMAKVVEALEAAQELIKNCGRFENEQEKVNAALAALNGETQP